MQFSQHRSKQRPASRHVAEDDTEEPKEFGDQQTCDHIILGKGEESVLHDKAALVCLDRGTRWMDSFPDETNDYDCSYRALQSFNGTLKPKLIFTDVSGELKKSCKSLGYSQDTCTPHKPQSNGVAERAVRRTKEGTACQMVQSGFMAAWWHLAMRHFCFLYNVCELCVARGHSMFITPHEARFGQPFKQIDIIPFGAECTYRPSNPDDIAK